MDRYVGHKDAIRLFWWKGEPNFGDALSPLIVGAVSGRAVRHGGAAECDMLALGSLVQVMRKHYTEPAAQRPVIWGAGLLNPVPRDFVANIDIALLRGPISAALLGVQAQAFGDPGLLAPGLLKARPPRHDKIAIIPHHSIADDAALLALVHDNPVLEMIRPEQDPIDVCHRIASSRHVISASLHGLVLADAFSVPSTWLTPGAQSHLKYYDYAASIGRPLTMPVTLGALPDLLTKLPDSDGVPWQDGIDRARLDLIETFPAFLKADTNTARATARA